MKRRKRCNSLVQQADEMLYQLLPFLLAAQTSVTNDTWNHGPEYTFSGHAKMISALERDEGRFMGNKAIFNLKCRPRTNDTLACRFTDPKIARITPSSFAASGIEVTEEYKPLRMVRERFDIKFDERGIEGFVIESTDPPLHCFSLDMARLLCNQLNVGASLVDQGKPTFRTLENSTIGECETDFTISRKPGKSISDEDEGGNRGFELVGLRGLGELGNETIEIEKKRDVADCLRCSNYFFGTRYLKGIVLRDIYTKLKSSTSRLSISKWGLEAETTNKVEVFGQDRQRQGDIIDHMMLKLESVLPAQVELADLANTIVADVIADCVPEA